jgi:SlyX protein
MIGLVGVPSPGPGRIASNTAMAHPHEQISATAPASASTDEELIAAASPVTRVDRWAEADARLTELEVKASYADDLLDALNSIVAQQQQQIDRLLREVQQLRQQSAEDPASPRTLRDELPPHY